MAHDVFLSYRSEDKAAADRLCAGLESQGIHCWIAPRNIPAGTEWPTAIVEAIGQCRIFVMLLSSHSKNAKQISREAELADKQGCQIVTFRVEDVEPPPGLSYFLGNIQWLDAFGDKFDGAQAQLVQVIKKAPEAGAGATAMPAAEAVPAAVVDAPKKPVAWMGIAGAAGAAVLAFGIWFGVHRSQPVVAPPQPSAAPGAKTGSAGDGDEMGQAKAGAERYLNERESGNLDAAWAEMADTLQTRLDRSKWMASQAELQQHGRVINKFNGCTVAGNGYYCDYRLAYGDGTNAEAKVWVIRSRDGVWKISRSETHTPPKS